MGHSGFRRKPLFTLRRRKDDIIFSLPVVIAVQQKKQVAKYGSSSRAVQLLDDQENRFDRG